MGDAFGSGKEFVGGEIDGDGVVRCLGLRPVGCRMILDAKRLRVYAAAQITEVGVVITLKGNLGFFGKFNG